MTFKARILSIFTKLFKDYTYNHSDIVFAEPVVKCWFSSPKYSSQPTIWLVSRKSYGWRNNENKKYYFTYSRVLINDNGYKSICHRLPNGLKPGQYVWSSNIRKKLRKFGLGWIPPCIRLPRWLYFGIHNIPLGWKIKWDECRYEYPPRWSVFFFGFSFNISVHAPTVNSDNRFYRQDDDSYWEGILEFQGEYHNSLNRNGDITEDELKRIIDIAIRNTGYYTETSYSKEEQSIIDSLKDLPWKEQYEKTKHLGTKNAYIRIRPEYLKDKWKEQFYITKSQLQEQQPDTIWA